MASDKNKRIIDAIAAQKARVEAGRKMAAMAVKNDAEWFRKGGTRN